jgi:hypothetical protein
MKDLAAVRDYLSGHESESLTLTAGLTDDRQDVQVTACLWGGAGTTVYYLGFPLETFEHPAAVADEVEAFVSAVAHLRGL